MGRSSGPLPARWRGGWMWSARLESGEAVGGAGAKRQCELTLVARQSVDWKGNLIMRTVSIRTAALGAVITISLFGCGIDAASSEATGESSSAMVVSSSASGGAGVLGQGFDPQSVAFRGECVTGDVAYSGSPSASIKMTRSLSVDELRESLGVDVSASVSAGAFNGNVAVKFATESASSRFSESFVFSYEMLGKRALLTNGQLTPKGTQLLGKDVDVRKAACGTEYVDQVELGAQLFVSVRFDFATESAKDEFKLQLGGSIPIGKLQVAVDLAKSSFKKNVTVKVSALQIGGNASKLSTFLRPDAANKVPSLLCGIDTPEECEKAIAAVVNYATTDFPTQVNDLKWDPTRADGAAVLKYHTKEYVAGGFHTLLAEPSPITKLAILQNRQDLYRRLLVLYQDRTRINSLKEKVFALSDEERTAIDAIETKILAAEREILFASTVCYDQIDQCGTVASETFQRLNQQYNYVRDDLIKLPTFFDYCSGYEADDAGELQATVNAILKSQGLESYSCLQAAKQLKTINSIDLSSKNISDVRPLLGLWNLGYLNLRNNRVRTLAPLASLTKLVYLDLRNNGIENIGELENLKMLKSLDLANNRIRLLMPLRNLTNLEELKLFGNPIVDESPIAGLHLRKKLVWSDDICRAERDTMLQAGRISADEHEMYTEVNFAPIYATPGSRESAVREWVFCDAAVQQLPEAM